MSYDMHADFEWFIENQDELVAKYNGRTLAIRNGKVLGAYSNAREAVDKTTLPMGSYMVQLCIPGKEAYTMKIYTPGVVI